MAQPPLRKVTEKQLLQLCQMLWSWELCEQCNNGKSCVTGDCPSNRLRRLGRFLQYYKDLTGSYQPDLEPGERRALSTHEDLFRIIQRLRLHPHMSRGQLANGEFATVAADRLLKPAPDQHHAINLAVRVMTMVNCSAQEQSQAFLEHGNYQVPWRSDVPFSQFISDIFPKTDHPEINDDSRGSSSHIRTALMARKLRKHAGLDFRATDDLRRHLKLDRRTGIVEIYHHTAFLKEHLRLTRDHRQSTTMVSSLLW